MHNEFNDCVCCQFWFLMKYVRIAPPTLRKHNVTETNTWVSEPFRTVQELVPNSLLWQNRQIWRHWDYRFFASTGALGLVFDPFVAARPPEKVQKTKVQTPNFPKHKKLCSNFSWLQRYSFLNFNEFWTFLESSSSWWRCYIPLIRL